MEGANLRNVKLLQLKALESIYADFFQTCKTFGILPVQFNVQALELVPISSGIYYKFFVCNMMYLLVNCFKAMLLLGINCYTNFEFEDIPGGYFLQVTWILGIALAFSMLYSWTRNPEAFCSAISSWLILEKRAFTGKHLK
jgi:hypothetical protein